MARRPTSSAVTVRMFDPGTGWSLAEARGLLAQGYPVDHVHQRTGWPPAMLLARKRPQNRSGR